MLSKKENKPYFPNSFNMSDQQAVLNLNSTANSQPAGYWGFPVNGYKQTFCHMLSPPYFPAKSPNSPSVDAKDETYYLVSLPNPHLSH